MQSTFLRFTGGSPTMRVMEYLIEMRNLDFCISDLADNARVSRPTLYSIWDDLLEYNMIRFTRTVGKSKLYTINKENPNVARLIAIYESLIENELKIKAKRKRVKV